MCATSGLRYVDRFPRNASTEKYLLIFDKHLRPTEILIQA